VRHLPATNVTMRAWLLALVVATLASACRAPLADFPDASVVFAMGVGSSLSGHDILLVTDRGDGYYMFRRPAGAKQTRFVVPRAKLAGLSALLREIRFAEMDRVYTDPNVVDGAQWFVWARTEHGMKASWFDNRFPDGIERLAAWVDAEILRDAAGHSLRGIDGAVDVPADVSRALEERWDPGAG
jgi:hypothetical protein